MHIVQGSRRGIPAPALTRRGVVSALARLAGGFALTATLVGFAWAQPVAAQDDTITLTRGGSTLTVSPGHADAVSAVAEAHASPGHAETIAAAARAVADCEDGALAEGAAALAVAHPDEGALTQSAATEIVASNQSGDGSSDGSADGAYDGSSGGTYDGSSGDGSMETPEEMAARIMSENDALKMVQGGGYDGGSGDGSVRKDVEDRCGKEERVITPPEEVPVEVPVETPVEVPVVEQVPVTGTGLPTPAELSLLFAAAAAAAAAGAVSLRGRGLRDLAGFLADRAS